MTFITDITGRFLINVEKIEIIDHKPDGTWWVEVGHRDFEVAENVLQKLREILEREYA